MKVYAVSEGSYSDYKVLAIFANREAAEECRSLASGNEVEEYELYESVPPKVVVHSAEAYPFNADPDIRTIVRWPWDMWFYGLTGARPSVETRNGALRVYGTNLDTVKKAFYDRRAKMQAKAAGL